MPVTLPSLEPINAKPSPPRLLFWLALLAVCMIAGGTFTLATSPSDPHQRDHWFWFQLLVLPALLWCMAFGLRRHFHDTRSWLHEGEVAARTEDYDDAVSFGQDPLAVIGVACLSALPEGMAARALADGAGSLVSRDVGAGAARRHSAIAFEDTGGALVDRTYRAFDRLLHSLEEALTALPAGMPFDIRLQWPIDLDQDVVLPLWERAWRAHGLHPAPVSRIPDAAGLMLLDEWLDHREGPELERFALIVAVQLHDDPPVNSAEVAVGVVLGWSNLASRANLPAIAHVHRPVSAIGAEAFPDSLQSALLWGNLEARDVAEAWQSDDTGRELFLKHAAGMGLLQSDGLTSFHDIPAALGDPGAAAEWFTLAMAIERAGEVKQPQMVVCGFGMEPPAYRLMAVRPAPSSPDHQGDWHLPQDERS